MDSQRIWAARRATERAGGRAVGYVGWLVVLALYVGLVLLAWSTFLMAQDRCTLALSMAFDVSDSVDTMERDMMARGIAAALVDQEVVDLVEVRGGVLMQAFRWSGVKHQEIVAPWRMVTGKADLEALADEVLKVRAAVTESVAMTALGRAMRFGVEQLAGVPCMVKRLDVVGDGLDNVQIQDVLNARATAKEAGIIINGLAVGDGKPSGVFTADAVQRYYRDNVITGPGSFALSANTFAAFQVAFRQKLLLEMALAVSEGGRTDLPPGSTHEAQGWGARLFRGAGYPRAEMAVSGPLRGSERGVSFAAGPA